MQATKFDPLQRVLIVRSNGDVESWIVLHYLDGRVVVGAEVDHPYGMCEATKSVQPLTLTAWQEGLAGRPYELRAASETQLEVARRWAESYAADDAEYGKG